MMIVGVFLLACAPLLLLLGSFLAGGRDVAARGPASSGAQGALAAIGLKALPGKLVARVLSRDDWDFIANHPMDTLPQVFDGERRAILRLWLRELRRQVDQLMDLHRRAVRPNLGVNFAFELKLLRDYALFRAAYAALFNIPPPSDSRRFAEQSLGLAEVAGRLEHLLETRLAGIDPARLCQIQADWKRPAIIADGEVMDEQETSRIRNLEVESAIEAIKKRELSGMRSEFSGLTYLSSTRDYNSGRYYHEDLARRFGEEAMERALAACHKEVFERLVYSPLAELARQLEIYVSVIPEAPTNILRAWSKLEPFRVLMPMSSDRLSAELFVSNVRVALAILRSQRNIEQLT
jgi:hypothetical protein